MRASPPFRITVQCFGLWRGCVSALMLAALGALLSWSLLVAPGVGTAAVAGAWSAAVLAIAAAATLLRRGAFTLAWIGEAWQLHERAVADDGASTGELSITLDLGAWMLLKFNAAGGRSTWLPVQRRGHEPHWHAFRCAVYSPRPAPGREPDHEPLASRSRAQSHA